MCRRVRYQETHNPDDLSQAIELFRGALDASAGDAAGRALYLDNLATGSLALYEHTGELVHLDQAIEAQEAALAEAAEDSADRIGYLNNLGNSLRTRHAARADVRDLDRARLAFEEALTDPADARDGPLLLDNLALTLRDYYHRSGDLAHLERAIELHREAVAKAPARSQYRPQLLGNLAGALLTQYSRSNALSDLQEAIELFEQVVTATRTDSPDRPVRLTNLAVGLRARHDRTQDPADLERAIALNQEAIAMTPPQAPDRTMYITNLGVCVRTRYDHTYDLADLERAIQAFQQAVDGTPPGSPDLASRLHNPGGGLRDRYERTGAPDDLTSAVDAYRQSVRQGMEAGAEFGLGAARRWGRWAARRQAWAEAAEAYRLGIRAFHRLFRTQLFRQHKEVWLGEQEELWTRGAYAFAKAGDLHDAAAALEAGRAMLLSEVLERDRADLTRIAELGRGHLVERYREAADRVRRLERVRQQPAETNLTPAQRTEALRSAIADLEMVIAEIKGVPGYEGFLEVPSFGEVMAAAAATPLIYVTATEHGGLALVVPPSSRVQPVWLPTLTDQAVRDAAGDYLEAYVGRRTDRGTWRAALVKVTGRLWHAVMGAVLEALAPAPRAVIIPTGLLGSLPLHAAWTEDAAWPSGRRYALDQVLLTYTPNARALQTAVRLAEATTADGVLAVDDPRPVTAEPLPNTGREVQAVLGVFPRRRHLRGQHATKASVLGALDGWPVLHFACHGSADPAVPLDSALLMAHDQPLTLRDVMDERLSGARLAVLSACETAVVGRELPDEAVNLPTGFLEAGIPGVVGSLWSVPDISTALLMIRFYELWRREGLQPADALRRAQQWIRDSTNVEKQAALPDLPELAGPEGAAARAFWAEARAHSDPSHWAAFIYVGV